MSETTKLESLTNGRATVMYWAILHKSFFRNYEKDIYIYIYLGTPKSGVSDLSAVVC